MKLIDKIFPISQDENDDYFITCASFEERFFGVPQKTSKIFFKNLILFRFLEKNESRKKNINKLEEKFNLNKSKTIDYKIIDLNHGEAFSSILELNKLLKDKISSALRISLDITTFTKELLLTLIIYLLKYIKIKKLRLFYTVPRNYATPEEGSLSIGIKEIKISPLCWTEWLPTKNNLLIILLGFEEKRASTLIDSFSSDVNWLLISNPGSKIEWNHYCEEFNLRLIRKYKKIGQISTLNPNDIYERLNELLNDEIVKNYNIFIAPLGSKPQIIGILQFFNNNSDIPINILTTTVVKHNIPYYSWGIGDTYEYFFPLKN